MTSRIARPANEVFAWHERPGAFERLQPPWERVELVRATGGIRDGAQVEVRTKIGPFSSTWLVEHRGYRAGREFRDVMLRGPFSAWEHVHLIEPDGEAACRLTDRITYRLPGGFAGEAADGMVRRRLERMFRHRHTITRTDLEVVSPMTAGRRWRVLVSGASGLVGGQLGPLLQTQGHTVVQLVRRRAKNGDDVEWNPALGKIDAAALEGIDAVVHLAGENVGAGRWTAQRKAAILSSRVEGTRLLVDACRGLAKPPRVWIGASAVGIYGDRGDEVLAEDSATGSGFLADVCWAWERETFKAAEFGARVAALRFGVVLTPAGGALARMLPLFRVGLGGPIGDGRQWMSWISIEDVVGAIYHALARDNVTGVLNTVAPEAVRNGDFARVLGRVLHRPAVLRAPTWALTAIFGEMARETVLAGQRAQPDGLRGSGYAFRHPSLETALRAVLGRENG
ncbi:TIGR01777 family oxidoreductase [Horticoccus luteus]|uniref:TIGR01777 family oxidoreductase n=1 Tax=Horticoccus luteus TaxID=2862869 RepID=A0A8F9TZ80_9BACT|nr:TIGR01777 family oxidoreductase [Horticoccus luteus]QYM80706.1 TIGR01777 family oxidoreductase [Horticoccus luteus]